MKPNQLLKKTASILVSIFFFQNVVLLHATEANIWQTRRESLKPQDKTSPNDEFTKIIAPFATITDISLSQNPNAKIVFLVQDAHLQTEAQTNIAGTITALANVKPGLLVGLEGAHSDRIDFSKYDAYPHRLSINQVAQKFLKANVINGVEFAAIGYKSEDEGAVALPFDVTGIENESEYLANIKTIQDAVPLKKEADAALADLKTSIKNDKRAHATPRFAEFEAKMVSFEEGILGVPAYAEYLNKFVPASGANARRLMEAAALEKTINFEQVKRQKISQLKKYIAYVRLSQQINPGALMKEMKLWESRVQGKIITDKAQIRILETERNYYLLKKLANHTLTAEDWKVYEVRHPNFSVDMNVFEDFYRSALRRNETMVKRFAAQLNASPTKFGALVAGGFHSDGLRELLKTDGYSVLTVSPKITHLDENAPSSIDILASGRLPLDQLFVGERLFIPLPASTDGSDAAALADKIIHDAEVLRKKETPSAPFVSSRSVLPILPFSLTSLLMGFMSTNPLPFSIEPVLFCSFAMLTVSLLVMMTVVIGDIPSDFPLLNVKRRLETALSTLFGVKVTIVIENGQQTVAVADFSAGDIVIKVRQNATIADLSQLLSSALFKNLRVELATKYPSGGMYDPSSSKWHPISSREGPAMRESGKGLTKEQHEIVNKAIGEFFTDPHKKSKKRMLDMHGDEYKILDPEHSAEDRGVLYDAGISIWVFEGLMGRIVELCQQAGVDPPRDLISHPGRSRGNIYLDSEAFKYIAVTRGGKEDFAWRQLWARHELAHIDSATRDLPEKAIQKIAPLPNVVENFSKWIDATMATIARIVDERDDKVLEAARQKFERELVAKYDTLMGNNHFDPKVKHVRDDFRDAKLEIHSDINPIDIFWDLIPWKNRLKLVHSLFMKIQQNVRLRFTQQIDSATHGNLMTFTQRFLGADHQETNGHRGIILNSLLPFFMKLGLFDFFLGYAGLRNAEQNGDQLLNPTILQRVLSYVEDVQLRVRYIEAIPGRKATFGPEPDHFVWGHEGEIFITRKAVERMRTTDANALVLRAREGRVLLDSRDAKDLVEARMYFGEVRRNLSGQGHGGVGYHAAVQKGIGPEKAGKKYDLQKHHRNRDPKETITSTPLTEASLAGALKAANHNSTAHFRNVDVDGEKINPKEVNAREMAARLSFYDAHFVLDQYAPNLNRTRIVLNHQLGKEINLTTVDWQVYLDGQKEVRKFHRFWPGRDPFAIISRHRELRWHEKDNPYRLAGVGKETTLTAYYQQHSMADFVDEAYKLSKSDRRGRPYVMGWLGSKEDFLRKLDDYGKFLATQDRAGVRKLISEFNLVQADLRFESLKLLVVENPSLLPQTNAQGELDITAAMQSLQRQYYSYRHSKPDRLVAISDSQKLAITRSAELIQQIALICNFTTLQKIGDSLRVVVLAAKQA